MVQQLPRAIDDGIFYPESDGQPMADNTKQFRWIVRIKEGIEYGMRHRPDVFVAGDLLWYPVKGDPNIRMAPDVMVVFGRPKGDRGSYLQWREEGIPPQVVFEVLSPGNRFGQMLEKLRFYERYGVEEYYIYDPDQGTLEGFIRQGESLVEIQPMQGWRSPHLGILFNLVDGELQLTYPDGQPFIDFSEALEQAAQARQQAEQERQRAEQARQQAEQERQRAEQERQRAEQERQRAERLVERLRQMGLDPSEL
ncbi:MAG: Uma2 family endonuclease [Thermostichus sp. DG02_2_bins_29]